MIWVVFCWLLTRHGLESDWHDSGDGWVFRECACRTRYQMRSPTGMISSWTRTVDGLTEGRVDRDG